MGLKCDGSVVAVGDNDYGQCNIEPWTDIIQVAAGGRHTVGLKSDGSVVGLGFNDYGQCRFYDWDLSPQEELNTFEFILTIGRGQGVLLHKNNGGTFDEPILVSPFGNYAEFCIADFNVDSQLDYIAKDLDYIFSSSGACLFTFPDSMDIINDYFQVISCNPLSYDPKDHYYPDNHDPNPAYSYLRKHDYVLGVIASDIDNDGDYDFLENINHEFGEGLFWIAKGNAYLNDGAGNFTKVSDAFDFTSIFTGWALGISSTLADVNGDGYPDMLASEQSSGVACSSQVYLLQGNGDGTFQDPVHVFTTDHQAAAFMTLGDFNNDGCADAIVGQDDDGDSGAAFLHLGYGNGTFHQTGIKVFDTNPYKNSGGQGSGHGAFRAYDADHDGILDIISAAALDEPSIYSEARLLFIRGKGNGSFEEPIEIYSPIPTYLHFTTPLTEPSELATTTPGDLDKDGDVDRDDVYVIRGYRNQSAAVCPECDVDDDGIITILDARMLMGFCTCPRCLCP